MKLSVLVFSAFFSLIAQAQTLGVHEGGSDRATWQLRLREDFQVEIIEDNPRLFDGDLLQYLYEFFTVSPKTGMPLHLHATPKQGSKKVWRRDQNQEVIDLYFSLNAGSGLYSKGAGAPRALDDTRAETTIDFNSDLYLQLTDVLYPVDVLQKDLYDKYHIITDCKGVTDPCDYFKKRELLAILGILEDLPEGIRNNMYLRRMIRLPDGVSNLGDIGAVADYCNGVIRVTSGAFTNNGDRLGEGTLVHEFAHAVWSAMPYPLRQEFVKLSWTLEPSTGAVILKSGNRQFVSEYSLSKPEEDFAEHFSAYFNMPEQLKHHAPSKWQWMKSHIFINTEYFSTAARNAKIQVPSNTPDIQSPTFLRGSEESIEVTTRLIGEKVELRIRLNGVVDDVSGFKRAELSFRTLDEQGASDLISEFEVIAGETRQEQPDDYVLVRTFDRSKVTSRKLYLHVIRLEDHAGNWDYHFVEGKRIHIDFGGTATQEQLQETTWAYENERQRRLRLEIEGNLKPYSTELKLIQGNDPGILKLHLPKQVDEQRVKLIEVEARFYGVTEWGEGDWKRITHNIEEELNYRFTRAQIESSKSESGIELIMDLRRGVNLAKMSLYWVTLRYKTLTWNIFFYPEKKMVVIEPQSVGSDPTPAEIEINDIGIDLEKPEGSNDELIIKTRLPLKGFENGGKVRLIYQTPSGKLVIGSGSDLRPGVTESEVEIRLDRYREAGEYIIREVQIMENSPEGSNPAIQQGRQFKVQKVMSRGVRKTIVIEKGLPPT